MKKDTLFGYSKHFLPNKKSVRYYFFYVLLVRLSTFQDNVVTQHHGSVKNVTFYDNVLLLKNGIQYFQRNFLIAPTVGDCNNIAVFVNATLMKFTRFLYIPLELFCSQSQRNYISPSAPISFRCKYLRPNNIYMPVFTDFLITSNMEIRVHFLTWSYEKLLLTNFFFKHNRTYFLNLSHTISFFILIHLKIHKLHYHLFGN